MLDRFLYPIRSSLRRLRRGPSVRSVIWKAIIVTVLVMEAVAMGAFLVVGGDDEKRTASATVTGEASGSVTGGEDLAPAPTNRHHTNGLAGYSFIPPSGWEVEDRGTMSMATSPDRDAVAALGPAFSGSIQTASERFLDQLGRSYRDVQVERTHIASLGGRRTVVTEGTALNRSGSAIRFGIYMIEGQPRSFAIGVFQGGSRPRREAERLGERISRSFRTVGV